MALISDANIVDDYLQATRYIERFLWIRDKRGKVIPFILNPAQRIYKAEKRKAIIAGKPRKFLTLKYRRGGITTLEQAENFSVIATQSNQEVASIAQDDATTEKIFRIANLFYDRLPENWRPKRLAPRPNKHELNFYLLNSLFHIGTAGNLNFGRGLTFQRVHGSEVARWGKGKQKLNFWAIEDLIAGLTEACSEGEIVLETTAKGLGGWFHRTWVDAKRGENDWTPIFLAWFKDPTNIVPFDKPVCNCCGKTYTQYKTPAEHQAVFLASLTDEEKDVIGLYGLSPEQIHWRRLKKNSMKGLFLQEYPEDDATAFIVSGICKFDVDIIRDLMKHCPPALEERDGGHYVIWKRPEAGRSYVIGADVGEGLPTSDFSYAGILDRESCEQVAKIWGRWKPEEFAKKIAGAGGEYNRAEIAVEANNHGHSCLNTLTNTLRYPNLYRHKEYDASKADKLGWQTNAKTRPIMLDGIAYEAVGDNLMIVNDPTFLDECLVFQDNGSGKYEALEGYHDDSIIAWAIAWQVRSVRRAVPKVWRV